MMKRKRWYTRFWGLLLYALMRSCSIEVCHIRVEDTVELLLMDDQHVVQALSSHTAQKAFTDRIRSRRMIRRFEDLDAARCCNTSETGSKLAIIITDEILRRLSKRSCLSQLLCGPRVGRRARHTDMDHFPRFQLDDEERKKRTKEQVSNLEEIAGPDLSPVIMQKRPPALPRWARHTHAPHVLLDRPFRREYPASVIHPEYAQPPKAGCSLPYL